MSIIDEVLANNAAYAADFRLGQLPTPPARKLAVLACMDARLTIEPMLGLMTGDAHIIRNAGGIATEDAIRSLLISCHLLGTREFIVINHTDCGMLTFTDQEFRERLHRETGKLAVAPAQFCAFTELQQNVKEQVLKIRSHPWVPENVVVRGFVYDVRTGRLGEVKVEDRQRIAA
jgi:carbonic anhydrase